MSVDPVGLIELSRRRQVAKATAHEWFRNHRLPEPTYPSVNDQPAWEWAVLAPLFDDDAPVPTEIETCEPYGIVETAALFGLKTRTVHTWKTARKIMPPCDHDSVAGTGAWELDTLFEFANKHGRIWMLPEWARKRMLAEHYNHHRRLSADFREEAETGVRSVRRRK